MGAELLVLKSRHGTFFYKDTIYLQLVCDNSRYVMDDYSSMALDMPCYPGIVQY